LQLSARSRGAGGTALGVAVGHLERAVYPKGDHLVDIDVDSGGLDLGALALSSGAVRLGFHRQQE